MKNLIKKIKQWLWRRKHEEPKYEIMELITEAKVTPEYLSVAGNTKGALEDIRSQALHSIIENMIEKHVYTEKKAVNQMTGHTTFEYSIKFAVTKAQRLQAGNKPRIRSMHPMK